jgi:hypothetical protein
LMKEYIIDRSRRNKSLESLTKDLVNRSRLWLLFENSTNRLTDINNYIRKKGWERVSIISKYNRLHK